MNRDRSEFGGSSYWIAGQWRIRFIECVRDVYST